MPGNFDFLKDIDKDLFSIITDAEKLYRDEYFEQCMTQTRRFGENVCKNVLGAFRTTEETFDDMLSTLKDKSNGTVQEKEFVKDLYFLKKNGNRSAHSSTVKKDGMEALECLQRAFEVAISYCVYNRGADKRILNKHYDIELLVTGKKNKSLAERYNQAKVKTQQTERSKTSGSKKTKTSINNKKSQKKTKNLSGTQMKISVFWVLFGISAVISTLMIAFILLAKFFAS